MTLTTSAYGQQHYLNLWVAVEIIHRPLLCCLHERRDACSGKSRLKKLFADLVHFAIIAAELPTRLRLDVELDYVQHLNGRAEDEDLDRTLSLALRVRHRVVCVDFVRAEAQRNLQLAAKLRAKEARGGLVAYNHITAVCRRKHVIQKYVVVVLLMVVGPISK